MRTYKIEVRSVGYDDHVLTVEAKNEREARRSELQAKTEWAIKNDIDLDNDFEMPFTRITRI